MEILHLGRFSLIFRLLLNIYLLSHHMCFLSYIVQTAVMHKFTSRLIPLAPSNEVWGIALWKRGQTSDFISVFMLPILLWDITYFLALFEWGFNFAGVYNGFFVVCFILAWQEQAVIARCGYLWAWMNVRGGEMAYFISHTPFFVFFTFSCDVDLDSKAVYFSFILFLP